MGIFKALWFGYIEILNTMVAEIECDEELDLMCTEIKDKVELHSAAMGHDADAHKLRETPLCSLKFKFTKPSV